MKETIEMLLMAYLLGSLAGVLLAWLISKMGY